MPDFDSNTPLFPNAELAPPPTTLTLLELPCAYAYQDPLGSASADDGMGDPALSTYLGLQSGGWISDALSVTGHYAGHLTAHQVTNGQVTFTHAMHSSTTAVSHIPDYASFGLSYRAAVDTRAVSITAPALTYHKSGDGAQAIRSLNLYTGSSLRVDTAFQFSDASTYLCPITFFASTGSGWGSNSLYFWSAPQGVPSSAFGSFNNPQSWVPSTFSFFSTQYASIGSPKSPTHDAVTITLLDSQDGAIATDTADVYVHNPTENWTRTSTVIHPQPTAVTDINSQGEWNFFGCFSATGGDEDGADAGEGTYAFKKTNTGKIEGTLGLSQSADFDVKFIKFTFGANKFITIGQKITTETSHDFKYKLKTGYATYVYWGWASEDRSGLFDYYDAQGFNSVQPWSAHIPGIGPGGDGTVSFTVHFEPI